MFIVIMYLMSSNLHTKDRICLFCILFLKHYIYVLVMFSEINKKLSIKFKILFDLLQRYISPNVKDLGNA